MTNPNNLDVRGTDEMKKIHEHTQTLSAESADRVNEDALWNGLVRFVRNPEKYSEQIRSSRVTSAASDRPDCVFERVLDFGSHRVSDCVYLDAAERRIEFHVHAAKDYPASKLSMRILRSAGGLPSVTFTYYALSEPQLPEALRPLLLQAWENKDKDLLEQIVLEALEAPAR